MARNFWGVVVFDLRLRHAEGERLRDHAQRVVRAVARVLSNPHVREVLNHQWLDCDGGCRLALALPRCSEQFDTDRNVLERFVTALWEDENPYALEGLPFWLSVDPKGFAESPVHSFPAITEGPLSQEAMRSKASVTLQVTKVHLSARVEAGLARRDTPSLDPRAAEPQALPPGSVPADAPPLDPHAVDEPTHRVAVIGRAGAAGPSSRRSVSEVLYEACVAFAGSEDQALARPPSYCLRGGQHRAMFFGYAGYGTSLEEAHRALLLELRNAAARLHDDAHASDRPALRLALDVIGRALEQVL